MPESNDKSSPLKDDLSLRKDLRERALRSASPAVKRPASDMDSNKDVDMPDVAGTVNGGNGGNGGSSLSPNDTGSKIRSGGGQTGNGLGTGKRQKSETAAATATAANTTIHTSNPAAVSQPAATTTTTTTTTSASEDSSMSENTIHDTTSGTSTAATSVMDTIEAVAVPSIDDQIGTVIAMVQKTPVDGQKGYCVSGKWLNRVLARASEPQPGIDKSALEGDIGPVDNSDIAMVVDDSGSLKDESGETFTFLRPGLIIGDEMQVLPQEAWDLVISWYTLAKDSPVITRYAHQVNEQNPLEVQYELHPPVFTILKVVATQSAQNQRDTNEPPRKLLSTVHKPYMQWLRQAKELVGIDMDTKVRAWKILGGLKSTSASGILTPAASRSASPAPGAEIVASAGSKMIVDVNTFSVLSKGEERELLEPQDQTMNPKYNGSVDLRTIGLGRSEVIVLEEQLSDEKYPSENIKISLKGSAKAKNLTVPNGRSSPTPSIMTRGRARREGRPKGIVGLQNLGNTCYMNSALQCIRSVEELTEYFRCGYFKKELNFDNPLGHHGEVAKAYGSFIEGVYSAGNTFTPNGLKRVVGKYGPMFSGYGQQDSQEFLAFLLDGLAEDLNRIHKKPYIEKPDSTDEMVNNEQALREFADKNWSDYKARNDSVITDLFAGMYKSTLTCPVCNKVSIVFDPFSNLTLQLPIENNWSKEIYYFPLHEKPIRIDIDIDKNSSILDMKKFIAQRTKFDAQKMICAESYKNKFFKVFDNAEVIAETSINANDIICIYELSEKPTNYNPDKKKKYSQFSYSTKDSDPKVDPEDPAADQLLVPVYHRVSKLNINNRPSRSFFAHPTYVVLSRDDRASYDNVLKKLLADTIVGMTTLDIFDEMPDIETTQEDSDTLVLSEDSDAQSPSASGKSMQDEDEMVDVSMRQTSLLPDFEPVSKQGKIQSLLKPNSAVPPKLKDLFNIKVAHTDDGLPTGWNSLNESQDYELLRNRAAEAKKQLAHRPRQSPDDEGYDSSADELANDTPNARSADSGSESEDSTKQDSDTESIHLPEPTQISSGKDTRGASKHQQKQKYKRKGKVIMGKPKKRTPPPPPQPKAKLAIGHELIVPGDAIILDWPAEAHDALFGGDALDTMRGQLTHRDVELFEDEELTSKRAARLTRKKNGVTLEDCLHEFGKTETLSEQNAWYCPRCKEHRRADKQFELWKVPDILVMHLKRFSSARNFRDKLELKVEYPVEGLDLTDMVRDQSDGKGMIYDLIAVDNHYGGLGGGHYTAYAQNFITKGWYDFNDSHVSQVKDPQAVVQKSAYLLFYRRRQEDPLGGPKLEELVAQVDSEELTQSRDTSPSGEGQRLGVSSHNGSSSASAGQVHHVGDGGLALSQPTQKMKDQGTEGVSDALAPYRDQLAMLSNRATGQAPPGYGDHDSDMLLTADDDDDDEGVGMTSYGPQNWGEGPTWSFDNISGSHAPPSSDAGEPESYDLSMHSFPMNQRRNSQVSAAQASSTGALGGSVGGANSDIAPMSDFADEDHMSFDEEKQPILAGRQNRESAPPPEALPQIVQVPIQSEDEDSELEVQELRIDSEGQGKHESASSS